MGDKDQPMLSRRQSLQLTMATMLAGNHALAASGATPASGAQIDLADPRDLLDALIKLRAATDGTLAIEWLKGVQYGIVDTVLTPFFTVNSVTLSTYRRGEDDSYTGRRLEVVFHGDLATNERLREWRNPYNGRLVLVPLAGSGPLPVMVTPAGLVLPPRLGDLRLESESSIGPAIRGSEHIWIRFDTRTRSYAPGASQPVFVYNETTTYQGLGQAVLDRSNSNAACQVAYTSLLGWKPWMEMGEVRGALTNNASGEKVTAIDALPADIAAFLRAEHPAIYRDPLAALHAGA